MVIGTALFFLAALIINEWVFSYSEFIRGINWVYLPGGVRLLCTLLFGVSGAVGLLIASLIACFTYFFPDDFIRSAVGGGISALAPYITYVLALECLGLHKNLDNLTPRRLITCAVICALLISTLHHIWFAFTDPEANLLSTFGVMFVGDLVGSLIILYLLKIALSIISRLHRNRKLAGGDPSA
ncbi:hypothetical protein EKL30_11155 [Candidimonas sp. SYP-B2681]|nr:hypothetical protein EKL30_11155 [Candidimonas sp. SYP-B2681]